jgi:hypothetical protein
VITKKPKNGELSLNAPGCPQSHADPEAVPKVNNTSRVSPTPLGARNRPIPLAACGLVTGMGRTSVSEPLIKNVLFGRAWLCQ